MLALVLAAQHHRPLMCRVSTRGPRRLGTRTARRLVTPPSTMALAQAVTVEMARLDEQGIPLSKAVQIPRQSTCPWLRWVRSQASANSPGRTSSAFLTFHVLFSHNLPFENGFCRRGEGSTHTQGSRRCARLPYLDQHPRGKFDARLPQHVNRCLVTKVGMHVKVMTGGLKAHHFLQLGASMRF